MIEVLLKSLLSFHSEFSVLGSFCFWLGFLDFLAGILEVERPCHFSPFHSVFGPCLLVSLDLSLISDLVLGSSPGTRAHSLPDLPGGRSPCSLLFHRLGCFWDKFDIFLLLSWRILVLCSFSGRRRRSYLADLLAASLESLEGLVRFLPSFGRSLFGLVPHKVSTTQSSPFPSPLGVPFGSLLRLQQVRLPPSFWVRESGLPQFWIFYPLESDSFPKVRP